MIRCLNEFRKRRGLKVHEMADKVGLSASFYGIIEYSARTPSYKFLIGLKKAFPEFDMNKIFDELIEKES